MGEAGHDEFGLSKSLCGSSLMLTTSIIILDSFGVFWFKVTLEKQESSISIEKKVWSSKVGLIEVWKFVLTVHVFMTDWGVW